MYSTASPLPRKKGQKASPLQESKGGKPPTVWQRLSVFYQIIPVGATAEQKAAGFPAAFCVERRRFEEDISNPCRRHTETLHYSRFTLHFYHPKLCKGEKPRHTPSVPGIARELLPAGATIQRWGVRRGGRAFPGRPAGSAPRDRAHIPSVCRQRPGGCPGPPVLPLPGTVPSVPGPSCRG